MAGIITVNGTAAQKVAEALETASVSESSNRWDNYATLALVLDIITIACIAWLLLR